jgi:hypothetical protein
MVVVRPVEMILLEQEVCTITQGQSVYPDITLYVSISASQYVSRNGEGHVKSVQPFKCMIFILICNIIQLMTFHEVNTKIDQPMEHAIHRGRKSLTVLLYDIKSNLSQYSIEFIIIYCCKAPTLFPRHPCLPLLI